MTIPLGRQTLTAVTRSYGAKDNLGVPALIETQSTITGCSLQPVKTTEDVEHDVDRVESMWKLWSPAGSTLTAIDAIITPWDGVKYEVTGDPQTWVDAFGNPSHETALLRRVVG